MCCKQAGTTERVYFGSGREEALTPRFLGSNASKVRVASGSGGQGRGRGGGGVIIELVL